MLRSTIAPTLKRRAARTNELILRPTHAVIVRGGCIARSCFAVIASNALWAMDSIALLFAGWVQPRVMGEIFTIGQAVVVAVLAERQWIGLRRSRIVEAYAER